jgi:hypothetical protein
VARSLQGIRRHGGSGWATFSDLSIPLVSSGPTFKVVDGGGSNYAEREEEALRVDAEQSEHSGGPLGKLLDRPLRIATQNEENTAAATTSRQSRSMSEPQSLRHRFFLPDTHSHSPPSDNRQCPCWP